MWEQKFVTWIWFPFLRFIWLHIIKRLILIGFDFTYRFAINFIIGTRKSCYLLLLLWSLLKLSKKFIIICYLLMMEISNNVFGNQISLILWDQKCLVAGDKCYYLQFFSLFLRTFSILDWWVMRETHIDSLILIVIKILYCFLFI